MSSNQNCQTSVYSWLTFFDLFSVPASKLFTYRQSSSYSTKTGILCSWLIIMVFSGYFIHIMLIAGDSSQVTWHNNLSPHKPEKINLTTSLSDPTEKFMFAVKVTSPDIDIDLNNDPNQYFTIKMHQKYSQSSQSNTEIRLVACTSEHWELNHEFL